MSETQSNAAKALRKAKRDAQRKLDEEMAADLEAIDQRFTDDLERTAEKYNISFEKLRAKFVTHSSARTHNKPSAWNGFIHKMAKDWKEELKGLCSSS